MNAPACDQKDDKALSSIPDKGAIPKLNQLYSISLAQSSISTKILESGYARWIVVLFFIGVIFQIIIAILNKYVNWYLYCYADSKDRINPKIYECCEKISTKIFIDITCDVISICSFICSTIWVLWICTGQLSKV